MFHLMFSLPGLYVLIRFIAPLPWPLIVKLVLAAILLVGSQYHLASRLSSGSVFDPEFARPVVIAFNLVFGAILLLAAFQLVVDLATLVLAIAKWQRLAIPTGIRYGIAALALVMAGYGVTQALRIPPLKDIEVSIPGLPQSFDGYRMLQLTDLHLSRLFNASWAEKLVKAANDVDVDLIVVTGDFIDGSVETREKDIAPLESLSAPDGVLSIPGNHEYYFNYRQWMDRLRGMGLTMLENEHVVLNRGDDKLVIAGLTDLSAGRSGSPPPDLAAALLGSPEGAPVILLDHQPSMAARNAEAGVALQLSGHTHGGMIYGLHWLVARANNGFVSGRYEVDGMTLYVNNGTALWPGFALRIGIPSELTRITLRAAP